LLPCPLLCNDCRYSMYKSPLPSMRKVADFYHTDLQMVTLKVGLFCCLTWLCQVLSLQEQPARKLVSSSLSFGRLVRLGASQQANIPFLHVLATLRTAALSLQGDCIIHTCCLPTCQLYHLCCTSDKCCTPCCCWVHGNVSALTLCLCLVFSLILG